MGAGLFAFVENYRLSTTNAHEALALFACVSALAARTVSPNVPCVSETWMEQGICREVGPHPFYPPANSGTGIYTDAILVCSSCPVKKECLAFALDNMNDDVEAGVYGIGMYGCWGGTTPTERFAMLGRRAA